jgi:DNA polymerase III alpha subunit
MQLLFKSNYSIGKSILTLDPPQKSFYPHGPESIFKILQNNKLDTLTLLEDNPFSFHQAFNVCKDLKIKLQYGLSIPIKENEDKYKLNVFMLNDDGYKDLLKIDSEANSEAGLTLDGLAKLWSTNLMLCVPFYDSFLYKNVFQFKKFSVDISFTDPIFFIESNLLPHDEILTSIINKSYPNKQKVLAKSIYYANRSDVEAYMTFKCICSRAGFKQRTLSNPNFDHFASKEFCFEAWKEKQCTT